MNQALKWGALCVLGLIGVTVAGSIISSLTSVATAPSRVLSKTMQTDNIISNYEWYHDVNGQYVARVNQIGPWAKNLAAETDAGERSRLRVELQAMQQSCRNLVTSYNANSEKINRNIFKGWSLPDRLDIATCEAA